MPAHNEEKYLENTINSLIQQTILPVELVVVDDGSTDRTSEIVKKFTSRYYWIKLIAKSNYEEPRSGGSKIVRAFYDGFNNITKTDFDFIVKLDSDLTLPDFYFERILNEFQSNGKIGICGGICVTKGNDNITIEKTAEYHIRGALKAYRRKCFEEIGGLMPVFGWDGLDEFLAMYHGWEVKVINDLQVIHHRPTGEETGQLKYSLKIGNLCYKIGYDPILTLLRAVKRAITAKKYLRNIAAVLKGYLTALFLEKKLLTKDQRKFIRKFQYKRLIYKIKYFLNINRAYHSD